MVYHAEHRVQKRCCWTPNQCVSGNGARQAMVAMKIERTDTGMIDRRVARTRALLQDALITLVPERGYAPITVEDICEKANIGRSTFYTHYAGKEELRSATIDEHLRLLGTLQRSAQPETSDRLFEFSRPMFEHAHALRSLHRALLASSGDTIHDKFRERIRRAVRSELIEKRIGEAGVSLEVAVQFISGAFLAVLAWWIAADTSLSPAQVDALFQQMAARAAGT
jgi:AcrR family transcriptional regulator